MRNVQVRDHSQAVLCLSPTHHLDRLLTASKDNQLRLWDFRTLATVQVRVRCVRRAAALRTHRWLLGCESACVCMLLGCRRARGCAALECCKRGGGIVISSSTHAPARVCRCCVRRTSTSATLAAWGAASATQS